MPTVVQIVTAETDVVTYTLSSDAVVAVERSARIAADAVLQAAIDSIASGSIPDGDKGSITVASSGTVWTINAGAVTNAMLAGSIAQSKVTSLTSDLAAKAVLSGGNTLSGAQVMSHTSGPVLNVSRSDTATTTTSVVAQLTAVTSNNMGDGFGPLLVFRVTDTGVTNELIGSVGFVRSGGDTTGDFVVRPQVAGVPTELFRFKSDGTAVVNGFTFAVTGNASVSGTNTGDQTSVSGNAGTATALQTARNINGVAFDGTTNITVTAAASTLTGTTLASNVVSSSLTGLGTVTTGTWNATAIDAAYGGTGRASHTAYAVLCGGTTSTGAQQSVASVGTAGQVLTSNGAGALPTFQTLAGGGSSPTTTRGDMIRRGASADERLALGVTGARLTPTGTDPEWIMPAKYVDLFHDFLDESFASPVGQFGFGSGGTGSLSIGNGESGRPGIIVMSTGTGASNAHRINSAASAVRLGGGLLRLETSIKLSALSDGTDEYDFRFGLGDTAGADHADGVYFEYDRNNSTNWVCVVAKASSRTRNAGSSPVAVAASTWVKLTIIVNAGATSVEFYIDGTLVHTETGSNIPNTDSNLCGVYYQIIKSAGTTARTVSIDYTHMFSLLTTSR